MKHKKPSIKVRIAGAVVLAAAAAGVYFLLAPSEGRGVVKASGTIEVKEADIASMINARVREIKVSEGEDVRAGQVLARLDDRVVAAQKEAAETAYKNAVKNHERSKKLYRSGSISKQQYENALSAYASARSRYKQAEIMLEEAEVTAPWGGKILQKHTEEGEISSPNAPLFTIGSMDTAEITIYVPLSALGRIKTGHKAEIFIDSFEDKKYEGTVAFISSRAEFTPKNVQTKNERVKQVFEVRITAPNNYHELKPGMPCDVIIDTGKK